MEWRCKNIAVAAIAPDAGTFSPVILLWEDIQHDVNVGHRIYLDYTTFMLPYSDMPPRNWA